jgi:hypothetical protein
MTKPAVVVELSKFAEHKLPDLRRIPNIAKYTSKPAGEKL